MMKYSRKCVILGCSTTAVYGAKGTTPLLCRKHKIDGMVDLHDACCSFKGCKKQPTNVRWDWSRCVEHKRHSTAPHPTWKLFVVNSCGEVVNTADATHAEIYSYQSKKSNKKNDAKKLENFEQEMVNFYESVKGLLDNPIVEAKPIMKPIVEVEECIFIDARAPFEPMLFDISTPMQMSTFEMDFEWY